MEISAAKYVDRTLNSVSPHDKPTQRMRYETPDISLLIRLDRFVRVATTTPLPPFVVQVEQDRHKRYRLKARISPDGVELASFFDDLRRTDQAYSSFLKYAPHLEHFFEVYLDHPMGSNSMQSPDRLFDRWRLWAEIYNDLCTRVHQDQALRRLLQIPRHNWSTTGFENLRKLNRSLNHLFSAGHDLTAYHLRLFASQKRSPILDSPDQVSQQELRELRACWTKFRGLWDTKPAWFPCRPAYVWSIESSLEDGYGIQLTLIFPASALKRDHQNAVQHARSIGDYWISNATSSMGHFRLTHLEPTYFQKDWFFGLVQANDVNARNRLRSALSNLAIKDALVRPKHRPTGKYFQLSQDNSWHLDSGHFC
ncbi:MAG: hypothetical protein Q7V16_00375 [Hydrogenophaga sp.]|nr:hypothetical protein [Hydrogenophaga sp.]